MFLSFMIPLPWRIENALGPPIQWLATLASTFTLQSLGFMAFAEGNVIQLNDAHIGVVEACSRLSYWCEIWVFSHVLVEAEKTPVLVGISTSGHWSANRLPRPLLNLPRASRGR